MHFDYDFPSGQPRLSTWLDLLVSVTIVLEMAFAVVLPAIS